MKWLVDTDVLFAAINTAHERHASARKWLESIKGGAWGAAVETYLASLRLEKACGLLRLSQERITEIAEQCGFSSIYSFSRAFHAAYGVSPMSYRRGKQTTRYAYSGIKARAPFPMETAPFIETSVKKKSSEKRQLAGR